MKKYRHTLRNNHGVALIIVLLVTALLIMLIFEFAFGTRVSLRAAANYRDSQRAYFIAHSAFGIFAKYPQLRDNLIRQGEFGTVPYVSEGDKLLQVKWEDESGKINITQVINGNAAYNRLTILFDILQIDQGKLGQIASWMISQRQNFHLLTELHQFLSDEEYGKIAPFLTVNTSGNTNININTASPQVLQSLGLTAADAERIVESLKLDPYDPIKKPINTTTVPGATSTIIGQLTTSSTVFKVTSLATVGGYTKQIDAIMMVGGAGVVTYWRAL
jgi:type II secretory pathway component PulK